MMSKKLDPNKLTLNLKKEFRKPDETAQINSIDSIVQNIHKPADEKEKTEEIKRSTIEMPKSLYKRMAKHLVEKDMTFKDYFAHLVERDLTEHNK